MKVPECADVQIKSNQLFICTFAICTFAHCKNEDPNGLSWQYLPFAAG